MSGHPYQFARQLYKAHTLAVMTRVNTVSGLAYRDDPAIFGWDIMNEPRSVADLVVRARVAATGLVYNITTNSGVGMQAWLADMAAYSCVVGSRAPRPPRADRG